MLGTLDRSQVFGILEAVAARDARRVLESVSQLDERAPDYREVLAELAAVLQKVALVQAVPDLQLDEADDIEAFRKLAGTLTQEDTQLFYQIAVIGRRDLELAPDTRGGFEMVLLRMLAFSIPEEGAVGVTRTSAPAAASRPAATSASASPPAAAPAPSSAPRPAAAASDSNWPRIVSALGLQGPASQLAAHCAWAGKEGNKIRLMRDPEGETFHRPALEEKLAQALSAHFGEPIRLEIVVASEPVDTPARQHKAAADDRLQNARRSIDADPSIRAMRDVFGGTVQPDSIRSVE
jgi:DNA polymerase-3 subunit gamma/tau